MGRDREIVAVDPDVRHLRVGQSLCERTPVIAVVHRDVEAVLGAGVEQSAADAILAHDVRVVVRGDSVHDLRPRPAEVVRAENVGREIFEQRFLDRDVRRAGVER